ncbi:hypothetical protein VOLCADRAFT_97881 [Volvox carteri f. nagariensis]|uniref:Uncharacterized protein n=1 Tax=Volvox carteri f. nagariensis TaxID=3068 RepID=D8UDW5_VOLCA|nr:uncharacterized protein VOLCADRAFT_97881 [Volvox carteri f. nagariensis]EFJ42117.1 hypothetical protein VOLCADRAFT_97881 [Volvox carteri f. nagariensis]|eukprot:XP_002956814.1 hypothetical protein VOLCADRAFT_97881 [Volvox carteri f. nagariensis]
MIGSTRWRCRQTRWVQRVLPICPLQKSQKLLLTGPKAVIQPLSQEWPKYIIFWELLKDLLSFQALDKLFGVFVGGDDEASEDANMGDEKDDKEDDVKDGKHGMWVAQESADYNGSLHCSSVQTCLEIPNPTANLCTGLHHYFVKAFAFDIMGYDILLIVEEDNIIHPQALQLLRRMAQLSVFEPEIGIVSLLDMDLSPFLDAERFAAGLIPVVGHMGHLWVFGLHRVKYELARGCLRDYYDVIKGHEYRAKHLPPLREAIQALMQAKGFPPTTALSQHSLAQTEVNKSVIAALKQFWETMENSMKLTDT